MTIGGGSEIPNFYLIQIDSLKKSCHSIKMDRTCDTSRLKLAPVFGDITLQARPRQVMGARIDKQAGPGRDRFLQVKNCYK